MRFSQMPKRWLMLLALLLAGCARSPQFLPLIPPAATAPSPAFVTAAPALALPQLIGAERAAARSGDLALLAQLWAPDARIIDSRGTPDPADDYRWQGRAALLDRYQVAVFPSPPPAFDTPPAPVLTVDGDSAHGQLANDRWLFVYRAGRWWLQELAY